ncbi:MAG: sensor histidine kinase [Steroidobacteraceae bacterium]
MATHHSTHSSRLTRDIAVIAALTALVTFFAARFEWNERIYAHTRNWEHIQLDEWPIAVFALALGLAWFAWRRYGEALSEIRARMRAEGLLSEALADNRRLAQHQITVQERDQKHLARELHDELGQYTNAIKLDAVNLREPASLDDARHSGERIVVAVDHMHAVLSDMIRRLRPPGLDELGLVAALESCIDLWRQRRPSMRVSLSIDGEFDSLGEPLTLTLYRTVQEALTNSARHSSATHVEIRMHCVATGSASFISLSILDDGEGAQPERTSQGFGLRGMRERIELMGGELDVGAGERGGFRIAASLPIRKDELHPSG